MVKLTLGRYWTLEDDVSVTIVQWLAEENQKIPADIRENLRGFFPGIGRDPEEADQITQSVAQYITMHFPSYQSYMKARAKQGEAGGGTGEASLFWQGFLARLQERYVRLDFYATFVETVQLAKEMNTLYIEASGVKIKPTLLEAGENLCPKTKEEVQAVELLAEIDKALRMFETIVPVEVVRYIGYNSHQIPRDTLGSYKAAGEMKGLLELKKQVQEVFYAQGYVQTGDSFFVLGKEAQA